jgi:hypothetical protein
MKRLETEKGVKLFYELDYIIWRLVGVYRLALDNTETILIVP